MLEATNYILCELATYDLDPPMGVNTKNSQKFIAIRTAVDGRF